MSLVFGSLHDLNELHGIQNSTCRIKKDLSCRSMAVENIKPPWNNFAHFAPGIAAGAFDKFLGDGIGVFVARFADEINEKFYRSTVRKTKYSSIAKQHSNAILFLDGLSSMASTVWKGYISFGLITIPIKLFAAARTERVSFNQIHKVCGGRIKQQTFCPQCNRLVERSELAKGFEVEKDRYVIVDDEEVKGIAPASSDTMEILEFVKADGIDPIYFDSSFFVVPEEAGKKAYHLLLETMKKSGYSAIAKITMHQREYTTVVRPNAHGLLLHTMFYPEEVREVPEFGHDSNVTVKPQEIALAEKLVEVWQPSLTRRSITMNIKQS